MHRLNLLLAVLAPLLPSIAPAATTYENHTFTTIAGRTEAGASWFDGSATNARFAYLFAVNVDDSGNIIVADTANHTIRKISTSGVVSTVAGSAGEKGSDDGTGSSARFNNPSCAIADAAGNIYVADGGNNTIRKITPAGVVTTIAGLAGVSGTNNGTGSAALFNSPGGIVLETNGVLFVTDSGNNTIRRVTTNGVVSTFAGSAIESGSADGTGGSARFDTPEGITLDQNNNLYVADTRNDTIRMITPAAVVSTLAGSAGISGSTNATGTNALFNYPVGIAADHSGNLFVSEYGNHTVRQIAPGAIVTTLAGSAGQSGSADGTNSATARFYNPCGAAVDGFGNVYVADTANCTVRKVAPGGIVTTLAGLAAVDGSADGTNADASFSYLSSVAVAPDSSVFIADLNNHIIRKMSPSGVVVTFAGLAGTQGTNDGTGSAARFYQPLGVAADQNGYVYVADTYNETIRKISPLGEVTTFAGKAGASGTNNGLGSAARFYLPFGVAVDTKSNVYVADTWNHAVRKISPGGLVTTLAGWPGRYGTADGTGMAARFYYPENVAVDTNGNVYVTDTGNCTIRRITPAGVVTTLAGKAGVNGSSDGTGSNARFYYPFGLTFDQNRNLLVADTDNQMIRKVTLAGVVTSLAGSPGSYGSDDGTGSYARFNYPEGVAVDTDGTIYVADASSHTVRKGLLALPDVPFVTPSFADPGVLRQFDISNRTTVSWSWEMVRRPAASTADLSSTSIYNPTLTPDIADTFKVRLRAFDSQGRPAIGIVTPDLDLVPPTIAITKPVSGQRWSNSVFTVTGTASDNHSVASVWCQANDNGWILANGTNNWTVDIALDPGTNKIRAYCLDGAGNSSKTSSVPLVYVVSDTLRIQSYGKGTISPNYSNRVLEIGRSYSVKATGTNGHKFWSWVVSTNWIGGTVKTNPTLNFIMQSNLTLQVNFLDIVRPTLSITSPTAGQRVTNVNGQITVKGKANDNGHIATVQYQLNGGTWTDATTTNGWTNWTAVINPLPRTNVLKAYALDGDNNKSVTNSVSFIYVVTSPITFLTNGVGTISRPFGNILEVGKTYSATAVPGDGALFSYWGGSVSSTNAALTFVMQSNMVLVANFIPNPFIPVKGDYKGLFGESVRTHEHSGFFSLTLFDHGAYSASLLRGTNTYPFTGQFDLAGNASKTVNSWLVNMSLDFGGAQRITGTVSASNFVAALVAHRSIFNAITNPASSYAGKYTLTIPGAANDTSVPAGDGYLSLIVGNGGNATINDTLADGNTLSQSVPVSHDGDVPLYQARYAGKGSVWGWLLFDTNNPAQTISGDLSWIKQAVAGATYYPHGFTNVAATEGSRYTPPATTMTRVINLTNGVVIFEGGNLAAPFTNTVTLTQSNRVINGSPNTLKLSITLTNGVFSGTVKVPGTTRTNTFKGALLQNQNSGTGYFLGTNQAGWVYFGPPL